MSERAKIIVEIINKTKKELEKIDADFKQLQRRIRKLKSDLDIDDNGAIDSTRKRLDYATRDRVTKIYTDHVDGPGPGDGGDGGGGETGGGGSSGNRGLPDMRSAYKFRRSGLRGISDSIRGVAGLSNITDSFSDFTSSMSEKIDDAIPSYTTLLRVVIALLPILVAVGAQAMGVAVALGAVAGAGAAVMGLGLLGRGNTLAEAMRNARQEASEFKNELFKAIQPAARVFAPLSEQGFDILADSVAGISDELSGLDAFEDSIFGGIRGVVQWLGEGLDAMAAYEPILSQLSARFGEAIGQAAFRFLGFITTEAYENQDALSSLIGMFVDLMMIVYRVGEVLARAATIFAWPIDLLRGFSKLLNNDLVAGLAAAVAGALALGSAFAAIAPVVMSVMGALTGGAALAPAIKGAALGFAIGGGGYMVGQRLAGSRQLPSGAGGGGPGNTIIVQGDVTPRVRREMDAKMERGARESSLASKNMSSL